MPKTRPHLTLFLLIILYSLNFLDRQILSILKEPIGREFGLNDAQLGAMGGLAFGLIYAILAVPVAYFADRMSRVWVLSGALAVWSACTALCGMAGNFMQLFIARVGVGVGEAGGVAPAYSLISDLFPPRHRAQALGLFAYGIPIGSAAGILFGALLAKTIDWRFAFLSIGFAGVLFAPVFRLLATEPKRGQFEDKIARPAPFLQTAKTVLGMPVFWLMSVGTGAASMVGYGLLYWMPTYLDRTLNMGLIERAWFQSGVVFFGGILGLGLGGLLADRLGAKSRQAYALIPAFAFILSALFYALAILWAHPELAFVMFLLPQALGLVWLGPVTAAVQHLTEASSRATVSALYLLVNNLLGLALGTYGFGVLSDALKPHYGADSIKMALLYGLSFYGLAAVLLTIAARSLPKVWKN